MELPRSTVVPVRTPTAGEQPAAELKPSMPDHQRDIRLEPHRFEIGEPPRLGFFLDEDDFDLGGGRMLITKTGDFLKGMSGSPVLGFGSEGPFVVGVASAGANGGVFGNYNAIAGGNNLTRLVNKARADFP